MKKALLSISIAAIFLASATLIPANAKSTTVAAKAPAVSAALKPCIAKYRQQNYIGAMLDLEEILRKNKNDNYAKYYLALCYTRLGYRTEAEGIYRELAGMENGNPALTYYSQRALDCLDNPESEACLGTKTGATAEEDDITKFINSEKRYHPSAQDRITKERLERKLQAEEYARKQAEKQNRKSDASDVVPSTEEIAAALNTLAKVGINPFQMNQTGYMMSAQNGLYNPYQYNSYDLLNNPAYLNSILQTNMMNYGI